MKTKRILWLAVAALLLVRPGPAETISFKFAYSIPSVRDGDINAWMSSYNYLWTDWQTRIGGQLDGEFPALDYRSSYEVEIRIPIVSVFSLSISASRLQSNNEGTVSFTSGDGTQMESHFIKNQVTALPVKLGLSISLPFPRIPLTVVISGGRHIVFIRYKTNENYDALFQTPEMNYEYWYKKVNTYNSQALGFYASLALEINVIRFLSLVVEGEQVWSRVDGFKGPYTFENYLGENADGKASLYYYNSDQWGLNKSYPILSGHEKRPDENNTSIRQGELNLSGIILKVGFRLKF
jgi:hypothetical protein